MTLYQQLKAIGAEIENHQSDLYVKSTPEVDKIIVEYAKEQGEFAPGKPKFCSSKFISPIDKKVWWDIFGAYDPFWESKQIK